MRNRFRSRRGLAITVAVLVAGLSLPIGGSLVSNPSASAGRPAPPSPTPDLARTQIAPAFVPGPTVRALASSSPIPPVTVAVGLASQDPAGLATYLRVEYGDGTPRPDHFLSTPELAALYGATPSALRAAEGFFEQQGLTVQISPDRLLEFVSGPAPEVAHAFGTTFVTYRGSSGAEFFNHPTAALLPASIPWTGAFGLSNASPAAPATASGGFAPVAGPASTCAPAEVGLAPCQVATAYDVEPLLANGTDGAGYRLAVVDAYSSDEDQAQLTRDLGDFDAEFGLPSGGVNFLYPVTGPSDLNSTNVNTGWSVEDALDLEWARAAAPGATIDFTFSPNPGVGLYEAVDWLVSHETANAISMSWGEPDVGVYNAFDMPCSSACNATTDGSYAILSPVLQFAAAEGISVFAASGDCGSADGTGAVATNYPASDPYVTGVGGTVLNVSASGTYLSEEGWSGNASGTTSPGCQNLGGSGGGYAPFPRPWWQIAIGTNPNRGVPDVSLDAGTAAALRYHDASAAVRGTSLSTPVWAGFALDIDQAVGQPIGFLNPELYQILASPAYSKDFHDIVSGNNGYAAGPGWDPVTGLGTPNVTALARSWPAAELGPTNGLSAHLVEGTVAGATPLTVGFDVTASGGTGVYPIQGVYFGDGTAGFAPAGSAYHIYTRAGVYAAQAYVVDSSGNISTSLPLLVVVGGGGILVVGLSASNSDPASAATVVFNATAAGGTPPYTFSYFFGDGTFLNNTTASSVGHAYPFAGSYCATLLVSDAGQPISGGASASLTVDVGGASYSACQQSSPPIVPTGGPSALQGPAPLTLHFSANASGGVGAPYGFAWEFGEGASGSGPNTMHTFASPGTYRVELLVADSAGDLANLTWNITVNAGAPKSTLPLALVVGPAVAIGLVAAVVVRFRRPPAPLTPTGSEGPRPPETLPPPATP
jgi:kumamolisin